MKETQQTIFEKCLANENGELVVIGIGIFVIFLTIYLHYNSDARLEARRLKKEKLLLKKEEERVEHDLFNACL